jgi:hypothetical protein
MYRSSKGTRWFIRNIALVGAALLVLPPALHAQRTTTVSKPAAKAPAVKERANKWVFGAHTIATPGVSITGPDFEEWPFSTTMGGGLGIMAGYELNRAVTAFASLDVAKQNSGVSWMEGSFGLVHAELGIRARLSQANTQSTPYLTAAIGKRAIGARITDFDDDEVYDLAFSGTMLSFGGGLQYVLSPKLALDGGVELGLGTFDHYDADGDIGTVSAKGFTCIRVRAGFVWRP